jgi:hypothetical protein
MGFGRVLAYFLKLGAIGFGGPIATVGYMQRDLVEQRRWMDGQDFLDGVALGQTMPGPLAAQVAMWVGYLRRGALGAAAVAAAFVAPAFAIVVAVGAVYSRYSGSSVVQALFYGVGPARQGRPGRPAPASRHAASVRSGPNPSSSAATATVSTPDPVSCKLIGNTGIGASWKNCRRG